MKHRSVRMLLASAAAVALLAACGSSGKSSESTTTAKSGETTTTEAQLAAATLTSSGSTFQAPFIEAVAEAFTGVQPNIQVPYAGGGSGKGQTDLQGNIVTFAGSDGLPKPEDLPLFTGGPLLYFPTVAGPITVSYNLSGVHGLKLSAKTLAGIFQGQITAWNDAAIKDQNRSVDLPDTPIAVIVRSDGSGTTANFTKFLSVAAADSWKLGTDKAPKWQSGVQTGNGNSGMASAIKSTPGAIGYVDYSDAKAAGLSFASIENASGTFVEPSIESASAAVEASTLAADLSYDPINAKGAKVYPITSPTWILLYKNQKEANVAAALRSWLHFVLTEGQTIAPTVDYAPLPAGFTEKAIAQIDQITG